MCLPVQVSALDQELIEVDPDTKEMLKLLVSFSPTVMNDVVSVLDRLKRAPSLNWSRISGSCLFSISSHPDGKNTASLALACTWTYSAAHVILFFRGNLLRAFTVDRLEKLNILTYWLLLLSHWRLVVYFWWLLFELDLQKDTRMKSSCCKLLLSVFQTWSHLYWSTCDVLIWNQIKP